MALVILPPDHRDADLSLATRIAVGLELEELHVFMNVEPTVTRAPAPGPARRSGLARLAAAVDELFERVADLLAPWSARQPKTGKLRRRASRSTPACSADTTSRSLRST
jgi:hypothetical protein